MRRRPAGRRLVVDRAQRAFRRAFTAGALAGRACRASPDDEDLVAEERAMTGDRWWYAGALGYLPETIWPDDLAGLLATALPAH